MSRRRGHRFFSLQGRRRPCMTGIEADNRKTKVLQRMVQPGCQLSGFEPDPLEVRSVSPQGSGNHLRLAGPLAPPDHFSGLVDDVNSGVSVRNVEPDIVCHDRLQGRCKRPIRLSRFQCSRLNRRVAISVCRALLRLARPQPPLLPRRGTAHLLRRRLPLRSISHHPDPAHKTLPIRFGMNSKPQTP
jgi:hypothetical protein